MMTQPFGDQPVLPLDREAALAVRQMRIIAAQLGASDAAALTDLADALEWSLNHTSGIQQ